MKHITTMKTTATSSRCGPRTSRRTAGLGLAGATVAAVSLALSGLASASPTSASPANLACDPGFESPVVPPPWHNFGTGQTIGCWTVGAGNVDLMHGAGQAEGQQYVDLDGTNADGEVHQNITTTPGTTYTVSFDLAGNFAGLPVVKTVAVSFGSTTKTFTFDTTGRSYTNMGWVTEAFIAPATTTSTRLSFRSTDAPNGHNSYGAMIDGVSVRPDLACDPGFESPVVPPPWHNFGTGQTIGCWTVGAGNVDLMHGAGQAEGQQYIDLDGTNADGEVHQNITTTPGRTYTVSFDLAGNFAGLPVVKTVAVSFGSTTKTFTFDTTGRSYTNMGWVTEAFIAPATATSTRLSFRSTDAPNGHNSYGAMIDGVSVNA